MAGPTTRVLWAAPRSASTAFERMVIERGDHTVFTEPFSVPYYYGADRVSDRYAGEQRDDAGYAEVFSRLDGAAEPVFFKDMPHHLGPHLTAATLRQWRAAFLIRDPAWTLPSMARIWADVTDEELGCEAQHVAFDLLHEQTGTPPLVIDSIDLRRDPATVVEAWCDAMDLDVRPDALTWEPGMPEQWLEWEAWFASTAKSTGFLAPTDRPPPEVTPEQAARIEVARGHYEALKAHALEV